MEDPRAVFAELLGIYLGPASWMDHKRAEWLARYDAAGGWIYRRPVSAGLYWWQQGPTWPAVVVELSFNEPDGWRWSSGGDIVTERNKIVGRWSGPIASPNAFAPWVEPAPAG